MKKFRRWRNLLVLAVVSGVFAPQWSWAYEAQIHQQLTFIAARQFNECVQERSDLVRLSALDTRYIVKSNVAQAEINFFTRMFRWNYYNRQDQTQRTSWGLIDTRFHDHFNQLVVTIETSNDHHQRLQKLGRVIHYIQDVTSPARVVPVYTGRWWRFSLSDRFDRFSIDSEGLKAALSDSCDQLPRSDSQFENVLQEVADATLQAVQASIEGLPTTWQSFWRLAKQADEFGEYGRAGNSFGQRTQYRCGDDRCLLLRDDPLYAQFAAQRHLAAALATMRTLALLQMIEVE